MIIFYFVLLGVSCYIGVLLGVHDCKKTFGIPRGARPEDIKPLIENTYIIDVDEDVEEDVVEVEEDGYNLT